ncbi:uncharacterized protein K460DRAFT_282244 [Cucurbitaria berberidis CBS 394.84]|uniref:BTB domain-containing protein n=1 Tax=Cucurbitaria berberidis CBS 394.84 TaxID=1168544 RepID=A0A9P4GG09_9PLEO|nr:uncharacterized protein K460DRAFT_282244 [Cucurbitaria berberidis CBS 394.84]KAF1844495.1 hypothetical protein K460DRAFT_282244 [Cucurbitaria berberidis CBS 394.84]
MERQVVKSTNPTEIIFVLAGRTTLSEHLPGENVTVALTTATRSQYLRTLIGQHASTGRSTTAIELRNVDPVGFNLFIEWLSTKRVTYPFRCTSSVSSGLLLRDCIDLLYAHIVGSQLKEVEFQDYIIDEIARRLDSAQTPDGKVLEVIFVDNGASSVLKRFAIDEMFAVERKMVGMLRGCVEDVTGTDRCEYHVHEEGKCYRSMKEQKEQRHYRNGSMKKTPWSADEDPDLKSMASYYLGTMSEARTSEESQPEVLTSEDIPVETQCSVSRLEREYAPDIQYFGSAAWSREVHGFQRSSSSRKPHAKSEKPLPPLPMLLPSPTIPLPPPNAFQPAPYLLKAEKYEDIEAVRTKTLINTWLQHVPSSSVELSTQNLIAECLERLALASSNIPSSEQNTPLTSVRPTTMSQLILPSIPLITPQSTNPLSRTISYDAPPATHLPCMSSSRYIAPNLPPLVRRKPAPPRGIDWVEQWDRLDALRGKQGFGLKRRSGKGELRSRFKEMVDSVKKVNMQE